MNKKELEGVTTTTPEELAKEMQKEAEAKDVEKWKK